jgi:hypothetical protein
MMSELSRTTCFIACAAILAAVFAITSEVRAEDTPREAMRKAAAGAPAMQGHDAEARMRDAEAEVRWRRLFFDAAEREEGEALVSCDHRAARRPDSIAGPGAVVILWVPASGRLLARRWESSSEGAIDLDAAKARIGAAPGAIVDGLAFLRCR